MMAPYKLTSDNAAAVAPEIKWLPVDENTPMGVKMMLIHRPSGVALVSTNITKGWWTHWHPLPTFDINDTSGE